MSVYDVTGKEISMAKEDDLFLKNMEISFFRDDDSETNYSVIRVFQTRTDGGKQYPFLYCPNGMNPRTQSTLSMNKTRNFPIAINAGIFDINGQYDSIQLNRPMGITIQNGTVVRNDTTYNTNVLTINGQGVLSVANSVSAETLVSQGIVSACVGVGPNPIIDDYKEPTGKIWPTDNAQRQIIGQFGNGDYAIITCEGRNFDNSTGMTIPQAQAICKKLGLRFAYNLDGGGSTETVIGKKQINTIYENAEGRWVPTFMVFNGRSTFGLPD